MAIETRSATKKRALEAARELEMDWAEWTLNKIKNLVEFPFRLIKKNPNVSLVMLSIALALTVTFFTTNLIEQLWALANGRLTEFTVSRK